MTIHLLKREAIPVNICVNNVFVRFLCRWIWIGDEDIR